MSNFSLISEFVEAKPGEYQKALKKNSGIEYQEYTMGINNKEETIYIPLRESDNFENKVNTLESIDEKTLKNLLREYRGIRNIK